LTKFRHTRPLHAKWRGSHQPPEENYLEPSRRVFGAYRRDLGNPYGFLRGWIDGWYTSELFLLLDFPLLETGPIVHLWWQVHTADFEVFLKITLK
jgi:hypothetical protein